MKFGVVLHVDGRGNGGGPPFLGKLLFEELLCADIVDELLTVTEEEGCHDEEEEVCGETKETGEQDD